MKIKSIIALCKKTRCIHLFGHSIQSISNGHAIYPLLGTPEVNIDTLCKMFDITSKQAEKMNNNHYADIPPEYSILDAVEDERQVEPFDIQVQLNDIKLMPIKSSRGITWIDTQYLAPLQDEQDYTTFWERTTTKGDPYIVVKGGLILTAMILPYTNIKALTDELSDVTRLCQLFNEEDEKKTIKKSSFELHIKNIRV